MLSTAIIHVCHPSTQNVRQQTPSVAPSVQANLLGLTGFQMGRIAHSEDWLWLWWRFH